ncbi:hypothetical protein ACIHFE_25010 [Streptomyces sp. NPDC052396]|uniref:hypothetical protein n=1 Tax=Streptomyces sp. NPDC052396 TaxID=3365689 RepID=UPI0037D304C2
MWRGANGIPDNGEVYLYTPAGSGPTGYGVDKGLGDWQFLARRARPGPEGRPISAT